MRFRCLLHLHDWTPGVVGTIKGADMYPPGARAALPSWTDIDVRVEHCPHCAAVRAVASWRDGKWTRKVTVSAAWALWQLGVGDKR